MIKKFSVFSVNTIYTIKMKFFLNFSLGFGQEKVQILANRALLYNQKMSRRFLKPFFAFWEPAEMGQYISKKAIPGGIKGKKEYQNSVKRTVDPGETFDNFFQDYYSNTQALRKEEKEFFEKHYPERVGKKFNPYEVLNVDKNADIEKIKQAYRTHAIKYHPKSDTSAEAQRRFNDIARAYNQLLHEANQRKTDDNDQDVSTKSLFEDFQSKLMEEYDRSEANNAEEKGNVNASANENVNTSQKSEVNQQKDQLNMKSQEKKEQKQTQKKSNKDKDVKSGQKENKSEKGHSMLKGAELYSESSYYEFINGQRKLHITKTYAKDGKTLKVDRIEGQLPDGSIEVNETLDDGNEVKSRKFIQGASKKQKHISQ